MPSIELLKGCCQQLQTCSSRGQSTRLVVTAFSRFDAEAQDGYLTASWFTTGLRSVYLASLRRPLTFEESIDR